MTIVPVESAEQLAQVRELFEEYWTSFGFAPCFQNFGEEVEGLPGAYRPPNGRLALATIDGAVAGCVALKRFSAHQCEAKRLYVRLGHRGSGTGLALLRWVIGEARRAGYKELVGDTMPVMEKALAIYDRMGFERTAPYGEHPTPGAVYLKLKL